jgi:hypothetical protein
MDLSYRSKSLPEQGDGPKFFVDSTISKDRTKGRKQNEEEVLKNLPQQTVAVGQMYVSMNYWEPTLVRATPGAPETHALFASF